MKEMRKQDQLLPSIIETPGAKPKERGGEYWYEADRKQKQDLLTALEKSKQIHFLANEALVMRSLAELHQKLGELKQAR